MTPPVPPTPLDPPDPTDQMERELTALTPLPLSPRFIPRFQHALARRTFFTRILPLVGTGLAAAALLIAFLLHREPPAPTPPHAIAVTENPAPTLADFRLAARQSPQAFDALLRQSPDPAPAQSVRLVDLVRSPDLLN